MNSSDNIKFLHLANHRHENLFQANMNRGSVMIGGFYNWHRAFQKEGEGGEVYGQFNLFRAKQGELNNYDILFIGMSKPELDGQVASQIREEIGKNSNTKLVICIDYAIELWQGVFNPYSLGLELLNADMVFVSEPTMQSYVRSVVNDKIKIYHIPHPTDINAISSLYQPKNLRSDEIVAVIHRYDNNWLAPFLATNNLREWNTHAVLLDASIEPHLHSFFKYTHPGQEFMQYMGWLSRKKVIIDSYHKIHTYGRSAVDGACLQIPVVGGSWQWAQKYLWPELTTEPGQVFEQQEIIRKLMTDDNYYDNVVEQALDKLNFFSYEERKKDFLEKLYN